MSTYYAIHKGHQKGVVTKEADMKSMIEGYPEPIYSQFDDEADAKYYARYGVDPSSKKSFVDTPIRKNFSCPIYRFTEYSPVGMVKVKQLEEYGFVSKDSTNSSPATDWRLKHDASVVLCHGVTDNVSKTGIGCVFLNDSLRERAGGNIAESSGSLDSEAAALASVKCAIDTLDRRSVDSSKTVVHFIIESEKLARRLQRLVQFEKHGWMSKNNKPIKHHLLFRWIHEHSRTNYRYGHWGEYSFLDGIDEQKKIVKKMAQDGIFS